MKILTVENIKQILERHGFDDFLLELISTLKEDFSNWRAFTKMPRPAMHVSGGVMELMPICDNRKYYTFKYVNCHPSNPNFEKQTVVATGQLSNITTGYPLMFSEMTVLTALRTAATSALATDLMARRDSHVLALIGTGAQSEFQVRGHGLVRDIEEVRYFDIDRGAMDKFEKNIRAENLRLTRCKDAKEAVLGADIITTITACKANVDVIKNDWVTPGVHINALGGDTIGKTELELSILPRSRVVVEYFEQSFIEGEIQRFKESKARDLVYGQLNEIIEGTKTGRQSPDEITLFDSVGIALEDYSVLRLVFELCSKYRIGEEREFVPVLNDPKNLIGIFGKKLNNSEEVNSYGNL